MSIVPRLAASMERRDEAPNIELAKELAQSGNITDIGELAELAISAEKPIRYNAIKTLYEIGELAPKLISPHAQIFIELLGDKNNRILWGSIQILDTLTDINPEFIATNLDIILDAADRSSVIARDRAMSILSKLNAHPRFAPIISPVILARLPHCAPNQFPMYAELAGATMPRVHRAGLIEIIEEAQKSIASPAKQKRLNKVLVSLRKPTG